MTVKDTKATMADAPDVPSTKDMSVSAKLADSDRTVTVEYDFGATLRDSVEKFGEAVVHNRFCSAVTIDLQSLIRRGLKGPKDGTPLTDAQIATNAAAWKPGVKNINRKSPQDKIKDAFGGMNAEQKKEMLAQLKADVAAAA